MAYSSAIAQPESVQTDCAAEDIEVRDDLRDVPAGQVRALTLPAVPRQVAQASRILCDARFAHALQQRLALDAWRIDTIADSADALPQDRFEQPGTFELAHPAGKIRVAIDLAGYPALQLAARREPAAQGPGARSLQVAVAGALLEPLCAQLGRLMADPLGVTDLAPGAHLAPTVAHKRGVYLAFAFDFGGRRVEAQAGFDGAVLSSLEPLLESCAAPLAQLTALPIPGRLILGRRRLSVAQLNQLSAGDILLRACTPEVAPLASGESGAVAVAAWGTPGLTRWHGRVEITDRSLVVINEMPMSQELDASSSDDTLATHDDPVGIGNLDLPVQFEVDTIALSIVQIGALRPGYVLELPTAAANAQIKMIAHGQTIGFGELVTVGEHIGVRILRMAHDDGSAQ
jgi:type III secretion protein Q